MISKLEEYKRAHRTCLAIEDCKKHIQIATITAILYNIRIKLLELGWDIPPVISSNWNNNTTDVLSLNVILESTTPFIVSIKWVIGDSCARYYPTSLEVSNGFSTSIKGATDNNIDVMVTNLNLQLENSLRYVAAEMVRLGK